MGMMFGIMAAGCLAFHSRIGNGIVDRKDANAIAMSLMIPLFRFPACAAMLNFEAYPPLVVMMTDKRKEHKRRDSYSDCRYG
jgi:hypothetical protein